MTPAILLLPSPLLPTIPYQGLVGALRERGHDCEVADASHARSGQQLIERWSAGTPPSTTLIAHSNAGYLAPGVRSAIGSREPLLFMDAALPPAAGETPLAPREFRTQLASKADQRTGLLPPWTRWWPRAAMRETFSEAVLEEIDAACPRLPVSYFDTRIRVPQDWVTAANAYLAFGDTYANELSFARSRHWPAENIPGNHLEFTRNPARVADNVLALLRSTDS